MEKPRVLLIEDEPHILLSLEFLLELFQKEHDWIKAIGVARQLEALSGESRSKLAALFYCELASEEIAAGDAATARGHLQQALTTYPDAVRASMMLGDMALSVALFSAKLLVVAPLLMVASMIGFITLFGIATRNGIMLVSHIRHLMEEEGVTSFRDAVERGAQERLVPILMTAMAAGLALIPLAMAAGESGSEIQTPMAIVILCGLMSSTLLNMVVVPTMYLRYARPVPVPNESLAVTSPAANDLNTRHAPFAPPPRPIQSEV